MIVDIISLLFNNIAIIKILIGWLRIKMLDVMGKETFAFKEIEV